MVRRRQDIDALWRDNANRLDLVTKLTVPGPQDQGITSAELSQGAKIGVAMSGEGDVPRLSRAGARRDPAQACPAQGLRIDTVDD